MTEELSGQALEVLIDALNAKMAEVSAAKDWKAVSKVARELVDAENLLARSKKEALQAALADITSKVKATIDRAVSKMYDAGELDGADGIWYSKDFGDEASGCRLTKTAPKVKGEASTANGSYVSRPEKSSDLLKTEGDKPFLPAGAKATIDKVEHTFESGLTLQEAFDYNTNGGWRNRVRMALLKSAGLV